jgi:hypothetical protein
MKSSLLRRKWNDNSFVPPSAPPPTRLVASPNTPTHRVSAGQLSSQLGSQLEPQLGSKLEPHMVTAGAA